MNVIVEPTDEWPREFQRIGASLRSALGDLATRIDHIGSTAVPGLSAKDIIDVQVTVDALDADAICEALTSIGASDTGIRTDHRPPGMDVGDEDCEKLLFVLRKPHRPANLHVRVADRFNQEYPLLCRDYLRTHREAAAAYGEIKRQLAKHFPADPDAYYDVKDPVFDLFMAAAREWAGNTGWQPGPSDS